MKPWVKRGMVIAAWVLGVLVGLVILVWFSLNCLKFAIYGDYYAVKTDLCHNPGLGDGFVCQGIGATATDGKILVSGYMTNGDASRIYVTDKDDRSYYVSLQYENAPFDGHVGGLAVQGDTVYVACDNSLWTLDLQTVLTAEAGSAVGFEECIPVNNEASFVYTDDNFLYVGEFHDGGQYVTNHPYETNDGLYHAIVSRYRYDDFSKPDKVYSIRDKVQGICFTPDGRVVLSTSFGLSDTVYYVYNERDAVDAGKTLDGAPVYYLNGPTRELKGPAMGEDLDYYDGKILTLYESASNKYIFGKFFFADKIVCLEL